MYKDIISYKLAEGVSEERLIEVAGQIIKDWMRDLPGFISWEISTNNDGGYTDIVCWKSTDDAKNAEKEMCNIPNAADWYKCYLEGSVVSKNTTKIKIFEK